MSFLVSARSLHVARVHVSHRASQHHFRLFSTSPEEFDFEDDLPNKQDFVKVRLEPGEWDVGRTDPIHRPPWKNKARIMSAEDFANRPRAGFDDEFATPRDAMLVLSWLDRKTQDKIYQSYLNLMTTMEGTDTQKTSHEYVMRVVAQKYNVSASRVAGVVQLLHNEDQIRRQHPEQKIYYEAQDYVDARIAEHIANFYDAFDEDPPGAPFIEDPMGVTGLGNIDRNTRGLKEAGDELDYDELMEKALIRDRREARLWIDNYEYIEDVDEDTIPIKTTADCDKLLKAQRKMKAAPRPEALCPLPESGETRPRWKYVAETINSRYEKKKRRPKWPKKERLIKNAIVEQEGDLRVASVAEVKKTCWKPIRNTQEFTYQGVKQAWLERTLEGKIGGWGRVERPQQIEKDSDAALQLGEEDGDKFSEISAEEDDDDEEGEVDLLDLIDGLPDAEDEDEDPKT
jgi:hypothetical protein